MLFSRLLPAFALVASAFAYPNPGPVSGNTAVHDPTVAKGPDGTYFLIATGSGLPIRTSKDRTTWTYIGDVFDVAPAGTNAFTGTSDGDLWAPDLKYADGKFILYYAASSFGSQKSGIFMAQSTTGLPGSWTDSGLVISSAAGSAFNMIDPQLVVDGSNWYLTGGSFWSGIWIVPLSSSTGKPAAGAAVTNIAQRPSSVGGAIEAPFIVKENGYFYLFSSWDACCKGTSSTYKTEVVRATSITGPYKDSAGVAALSGGGTAVLASHGSIVGPGGASVFDDTDAWTIFYHYYTSSGSYLGINLLDFSSGWPVAY